MEMTLTEQISAVEAVLFASGEPVSIEALTQALEISPIEFEVVLAGLKQRYAEERGVRLMRYEGSLQLCTRPQYMEIIEKVLQPVRRQSLTQAALETLAVVAYKQPVTRAEVEQVRGVKCDYSLQSLMNKELIMEVGRKDALGRPILYGTTENFLAHFGLTSLEDLPPMPEVPAAEKPEPDFDVPELVP